MEQLHQIITAQMTWSARTFGPGTRHIGLAKHLATELKDYTKAAEADDHDQQNAETVDVFILAVDGIWRWMQASASGVSIGQIAEYVQRDIIEHLCFTYRDADFGKQARADEYEPEHDVDVMLESEGEDDFDAGVYFVTIAGWALATLACSVGFPDALRLIEEKQAANRERQWPAPGGQDEPVEHIREAANV